MDSTWETPAAAPARPRGRPARQPRPTDPYVRWAIETGWRGLSRLAGWSSPPEPTTMLRIIGRVRRHGDIAALVKDAAAKGHPLQVPAIYLEPIDAARTHFATHFTARVPVSALRWLLSNPRGLRWRLALEMRDTINDARPSSKGLFGPDRDARVRGGPDLVTDRLKGLTLAPAAALPGAIVLIDHGCAFAHVGLADGKYGTRVRAVWDQGTAPRTNKRVAGQWPWMKPDAFAYGREMGPLALGALTAATRQNLDALDEPSMYRSIDYLLDTDDPRRRVWYATHGGHLMDVAAGWPDPVSGQAAAPPDAAAEAALVFVHLPAPAALDSSGASLGAHLLDGVRYAMSVVQTDEPLVINISYGGHAGPHDGSSLIEAALDELLAKGPDRMAIVLAAGNARESMCHARRQVQPGRSALLRVMVPEGDSTDSFVELWYAKPPPGAAVQLRVRSPSRQWSPWVRTGQQARLLARTPERDVIALLRHDAAVPNGRRHMGLLALAPTDQPDNVARARAEPGMWEIEARLVSAADANEPAPAGSRITLDAWIERDDAGRRPGTARLRFVDQQLIDEQGTLSSLSTGDLPFVVGGFNAATREDAPYSSIGFRHGRQPDIMAVCEQDGEQPNIRAAAVRSGESVRLNGTSIAAPVFARRLFNLLAAPVAGSGTRTSGERRKLIKRLIEQHGDVLRSFSDP